MELLHSVILHCQHTVSHQGWPANNTTRFYCQSGKFWHSSNCKGRRWQDHHGQPPCWRLSNHRILSCCIYFKFAIKTNSCILYSNLSIDNSGSRRGRAELCCFVIEISYMYYNQLAQHIVYGCVLWLTTDIAACFYIMCSHAHSFIKTSSVSLPVHL